MKTTTLYAVIESAQLHVKAARTEQEHVKNVNPEVLVQLTLALQNLEAAYDRVSRAAEAEIV